jgi:hypothetical protein
MSKASCSEDRELRDLQAGFCVATQVETIPNFVGVKSTGDPAQTMVEGVLFINDEKTAQCDGLKHVA